MATYKEAVHKFEPLLLLTFDSDPYDNNRRTLTAVPPTLMDESEWGNNGLLHSNSEDYPNYRMGFPSMLELEHQDQRSMNFGWYGVRPDAVDKWPKALIEVPHQTHLEFKDNNGSFTVNFWLNKKSDESAWRTWTYNNVVGGSGYAYVSNLKRQWIRKEGVFDMYFYDRWDRTDEIIITIPGGATVRMDVPSWFIGRDQMLTLTYDVVEVTHGNFVATSRFYINGHIQWENVREFFDEPPNTTTGAPIEIAGTIPNGGVLMDDRQTSPLMLDQISIFGKALTADEICWLYKKSRRYDTIVIQGRATTYWPFADTESAISNVMQDMTGATSGLFVGGQDRVFRLRDAPPNLLGGASVEFTNGGCAVANKTMSGYYTPILSLSGDFTIDGWYRIDNGTRSVLFSLQNDKFPYGGALLEANRRDGLDVPGAIEFSVSATDRISSKQFKDDGSPYNFNDGQWHFICCVKKNGVMYLWIDGILHSSRTAQNYSLSLPGPGQAYFMAAAPGQLSTEGFISSVSTYNYALDDAEIRMKNLYSRIYRVRGTITLLGNPHKGTVRALRHRDGELVREVVSDVNTGDYDITLYDNSLIDLMALNKQDRNIRYRAYGPITPASYDDEPI